MVAGARFFDTPVEPVLKVACGRPDERLQEFADRWGWQSNSMDWNETVNRPDVDIVDIAAPTSWTMTRRSKREGRKARVLRETPMPHAPTGGRDVCRGQKAGIVHYLNHNYRRCPAVALAKQLIQEGRLGRLFHWCSAYLQSWIVDRSSR